mmetsp:Transcript_127931/g.409856  ORF Transcript_127931/g.409856 Transcript_127931/m.409856 type:complete len:297 (-) Transcript_127931:42-932(-)
MFPTTQQSRLCIRRTFFDVEEHFEGAAAGRLRSSSAPVLATFDVVDNSSQAYLELLSERWALLEQRRRPIDVPFLLRTRLRAHKSVDDKDEDDVSGFCSTRVSSKEWSEQSDEAAVGEHDLYESLPSIGSLGHEQNECRPCAVQMRLQRGAVDKGCALGSSCNFCHFDHGGRRKNITGASRRRAKRMHLMLEQHHDLKEAHRAFGFGDGRSVYGCTPMAAGRVRLHAVSSEEVCAEFGTSWTDRSSWREMLSPSDWKQAVVDVALPKWLARHVSVVLLPILISLYICALSCVWPMR